MTGTLGGGLGAHSDFSVVGKDCWRGNPGSLFFTFAIFELKFFILADTDGRSFSLSWFSFFSKLWVVLPSVPKVRNILSFSSIAWASLVSSSVELSGDTLS